MAEPTERNREATPRDGNFRWWDLVVAFFGGTFVGIALTALAGVVVILIAIRHGLNPERRTLLAAVQASFWINHAILVLSDLGLVGTIWLVARRRLARPIAHFFAPAAATPLALAALSGAGLSLLLNGINEFLSAASLVRFEDSAVERALVPHSLVQAIVSVAVVALFAPFVEEYFFRGLFFTWARQTGGAVLAVALTAAGFALVHGHFLLHPGLQGWIYTVELFIAGVVLAQWVLRTGSLRTSFATHAAYNAAAIAFSVVLP
jgi:membrane protease YdiL (CAAX protease family)